MALLSTPVRMLPVFVATQPVSDARPCFGVACPHHASCFCYGLVESSRCDTARATCLRDGAYPDYFPACPFPAAAPALEH